MRCENTSNQCLENRGEMHKHWGAAGRVRPADGVCNFILHVERVRGPIVGCKDDPDEQNVPVYICTVLELRTSRVETLGRGIAPTPDNQGALLDFLHAGLVQNALVDIVEGVVAVFGP
jgi:hypothetical protein